MACLGAREAAEFGFEGGLAWRRFEIDADQLAEAVRKVPFSIGSCSLEEPDADLVRLFPALERARGI